MSIIITIKRCNILWYRNGSAFIQISSGLSHFTIKLSLLWRTDSQNSATSEGKGRAKVACFVSTCVASAPSIKVEKKEKSGVGGIERTSSVLGTSGMFAWAVMQCSGAVLNLKSGWTSWALVLNKPTVSVDVKQHFSFNGCHARNVRSHGSYRSHAIRSTSYAVYTLDIASSTHPTTPTRLYPQDCVYKPQPFRRERKSRSGIEPRPFSLPA